MFALSEKDGFEIASAKDVNKHFEMMAMIIEHEHTSGRLQSKLMKEALLKLDQLLKTRG